MQFGSLKQTTKQITRQSNNPWLWVPLPRPQAELTLFCFAYAGGNATVFRSWLDKLDPRIELQAIQLPGRAARFKEPLLDSMPAILDALEKYMSAELEQGEYAFFGHSMGASIAFELTRRLQAKGCKLPKRLIISGRRAPSLPLTEQKQLTHELPKDQFIARLKTLNGTPEALLAHEDLMNLMEPILRSDFKVIETWRYQAGECLNVPLSIYMGKEDEQLKDTSIEQCIDMWKKESTQNCETHIFSGDHFYLQSYETELLEKINACLLSINK